MNFQLVLASAVACVLAATWPAAAQSGSAAPAAVVALQGKTAAVATDTLSADGVPSASVAVAKSGQLMAALAFGLAHIAPNALAEETLAYPIGSISKQFTSTALLLLQEQGRLSLNDPVAKYFPELTRAKDITLRNLLTMTSGYEDYAPQDYIIPEWLKPVKPLDVVHTWAEKPLDFEPGTQWQYSNTNYVIAGLIVEKVAHQPLMSYLREHFFTPLGMEGVINTYTQRDQLAVTGYVSNAMAPVREQPLEGAGWYQGDGDLAMPAKTLVQWDLSLIHQTLLKPESYRELETPFLLKDGKDSGYGLGIDVRIVNGHRILAHSGEVGGFVADNVVIPDQGFAIAVLTNEVASGAASTIARDLVEALEPGVLPAQPKTPAAAPAAAAESGALAGFGTRLGTILDGLAQQRIDRALFTANCNAYFNSATLQDFHATLAAYGNVTAATLLRTGQRGGMNFGLYRVSYATGPAVLVSIYLLPDGKIEQLLVEGKA